MSIFAFLSLLTSFWFPHSEAIYPRKYWFLPGLPSEISQLESTLADWISLYKYYIFHYKCHDFREVITFSVTWYFFPQIKEINPICLHCQKFNSLYFPILFYCAILLSLKNFFQGYFPWHSRIWKNLVQQSSLMPK